MLVKEIKFKPPLMVRCNAWNDGTVLSIVIDVNGSSFLVNFYVGSYNTKCQKPNILNVIYYIKLLLYNA